MRRIIFSFLFLTIAIFASAQANERAMAAAIDTIVRTYNEAEIRDKFVEDIFNKFNKSAYLATRIAKSYYNYNKVDPPVFRDFHRRDTVNAFKYINRSIAIDPKYAEAYILAKEFWSYAIETIGLWIGLSALILFLPCFLIILLFKKFKSKFVVDSCEKN